MLGHHQKEGMSKYLMPQLILKIFLVEDKL